MTLADVERVMPNEKGAMRRYLVELMRLPSLPADEVAGLVNLDFDEIDRVWHRDGPTGGDPRGALILTVTHMGSNEAVGASIARHGLPISTARPSM